MFAIQRTDSPRLCLGLNDGTLMPEACVAVVRRFASTSSMRFFGSPDNGALKRVISQIDGVDPDHVFLHCGSGPILKLAIPQLLRQAVLARPSRVMRHLWDRSGFPILTPAFTYGKLPKGALEAGLRVVALPCGPETGFRLSVDAMVRRLEVQDAFVYLANPNNPTGGLLLSPDEISTLATRFPDSRFWIDEAYVHYAADGSSVVDQVPKHKNLFVSRSLSFAYGLASLRIGYLLAPPGWVARFDRQVTDYRIGRFQEEMAIAALEDPIHLDRIRRITRAGRDQLTDGMARLSGIEVFPSEANFVFARFTDGIRTGRWLADELATRGIVIKHLEPWGGNRFDPYFRVTVGLPDENELFLAGLCRVFGEEPRMLGEEPQKAAV